jgi:UPF0755 protein
MKKLLRYGFIALITFLLLGYGTFLWKNSYELGPDGKEEIVIIPKGATLSSVADSLAAKDLIRSKLLFKLAGKILGASKEIQAGSYRIEHGINNLEIISRLTSTSYAILFEITFPEGSNIRRVASIARQKLFLDSALFVKLAYDTTFLRSLGLPHEAKSAEGYLFPETYRLFVSVNAKELMTKMVGEWKQRVNDSLIKHAASLGLSTHRFMTLASIVEAEAQRADERDTIAGVYWNRLKINMKLDADPTVQYGLGLDRPITAAELRKENPYNTYMNVGLPPGPINNPGIAAIKATLNYAKHDKIFFVAKRDGSGGHYFAKTMAEQERNIRRSNKNEGR